MRLIGFILVLLGGLALGDQGFASLTRTQVETDSDRAAQVNSSGRAPLVVGAIAVVSGLLLLASSGRRAET